MIRITSCAFLFTLLACSTVPELNGRKASSYSPGELQAEARLLLKQTHFEHAAELLEYLMRTAYGYSRMEEVFFQAAEARFLMERYDRAFLHYRRLMTEYPYTSKAPAVSQRVWVVGKVLIEQQSEWFGDLSSLHEVGVEALNFLVTNFPRSPYADDAWKELAEALEGDHQYQAVVDIYERLIREYPESEWTDLATYRVTRAYRNQSRGFEYDVDPLLRSHSALLRYLKRFPDGNFVEQAQADLKVLEADVALHELEIAQFYQERGIPEGQRLHLSNAAARFPGTEPAIEASETLNDLFEGEHPDSLDLLKPRQERPPWERARAGQASPGRDGAGNRP